MTKALLGLYVALFENPRGVNRGVAYAELDGKTLPEGPTPADMHTRESPAPILIPQAPDAPKAAAHVQPSARSAKIAPNEAIFGGIVFQREGEKLTVKLTIRQEDGSRREEILTYARQPL